MRRTAVGLLPRRGDGGPSRARRRFRERVAPAAATRSAARPAGTELA